MANNTDNKTAKAIHINELRRALDISRIDRTPVDLDCWKAGDGSIITIGAGSSRVPHGNREPTTSTIR